MSAAIGALLGLLPHLLHHAGVLAGAALVTGLGGNLLLGLVGLLFSVPLFRRLHRRFGTWKAPAMAAVIFAGLFALSAFVIGPAISSDAPGGAPQQVPSPSSDASHTEHHGG